MRELVHPNLVNYVELYLERNTLMMVMEFMRGGALTDVVLYTILSEPQIAAVAKEVLRITYACFKHGPNMKPSDFARNMSFAQI